MNRTYYTQGNVAMRAAAAPQRRESEYVSREEIERKKRQARRQAARRNRERALYMSPAYILFLAVCIMIATLALSMYLHLQSSVTAKMKTVSNLESQITELRADNDARYKRVSTSTDLNQIKDIAINQLGMSYATEDQIVYFSVDNNNFMDQYEDIPEN